MAASTPPNNTNTSSGLFPSSNFPFALFNRAANPTSSTSLLGNAQLPGQNTGVSQVFSS